jgi:hypothetical protein
MSRGWNTGVRSGSPQQPGRVDWTCGSRSSARRWVRHACLQPTLGDGKEPGGFARSKRLVEAEYSAVATVTVGTVDGEGGAKAAAFGRVCRGRNDVLAHGNGDVWNLVHSGNAGLNQPAPSIQGLGWLLLYRPTGDKGRKCACPDAWPSSAGVAVTARIARCHCKKKLYHSPYLDIGCYSPWF